MKQTEYRTENWLEWLRKNDDGLLKLSRMDVYKATGKGGQKKNKTSNAIRLTLGHLSVTESQSRSKSENIRGALKKLRLAIALDSTNASNLRISATDIPTEIKPFLNTSEIGINPKNPVFPIFAGYFFDCYIRNKGNWSAMASEMGFTSSQIRKFIEKNPRLNRTFQELKSSWETTLAHV